MIVLDIQPKHHFEFSQLKLKDCGCFVYTWLVKQMPKSKIFNAGQCLRVMEIHFMTLCHF